MDACEPVGVLVLRLWAERADPRIRARIRARITATTDIAGLSPTVTTTADPVEIQTMIAVFIDEFTIAAGHAAAGTLP